MSDYIELSIAVLVFLGAGFGFIQWLVKRRDATTKYMDLLQRMSEMSWNGFVSMTQIRDEIQTVLSNITGTTSMSRSLVNIVERGANGSPNYITVMFEANADVPAIMMVWHRQELDVPFMEFVDELCVRGEFHHNSASLPNGILRDQYRVDEVKFAMNYSLKYDAALQTLTYASFWFKDDAPLRSKERSAVRAALTLLKNLFIKLDTVQANLQEGLKKLVNSRSEA